MLFSHKTSDWYWRYYWFVGNMDRTNLKTALRHISEIQFWIWISGGNSIAKPEGENLRRSPKNRTVSRESSYGEGTARRNVAEMPQWFILHFLTTTLDEFRQFKQRQENWVGVRLSLRYSAPFGLHDLIWKSWILRLMLDSRESGNRRSTLKPLISGFAEIVTWQVSLEKRHLFCYECDAPKVLMFTIKSWEIKPSGIPGGGVRKAQFAANP